MPQDWKANPRIKDPEARRRFRLAHIGEPCDSCEIRPGVHVHHRVFRSQGGDDAPENFLWLLLCGSCHDREHGVRSTWY